LTYGVDKMLLFVIPGITSFSGYPEFIKMDINGIIFNQDSRLGPKLINTALSSSSSNCYQQHHRPLAISFSFVNNFIPTTNFVGGCGQTCNLTYDGMCPWTDYTMDLPVLHDNAY